MNIDQNLLGIIEKQKEARKPVDNPVQRDNEVVIKFQQDLVRMHHWRCCLNCFQWSTGKDVTPMGCRLNQAMPPPQVFLVGCKDWEGDIPF